MPQRGEHEQQRRAPYRTARTARRRSRLARRLLLASGGGVFIGLVGLSVLVVFAAGSAIGGAEAEAEQQAAACGQTASVDGAGVSNTGPTLTSSEIAQFAAKAGFAGEDLVIAVAVAHAESGGRPAAINTANRNGSTDYGLWQINSVHTASGFEPAKALDPTYNARWARRVFDAAGKQWRPWTTFNTGAYRQHVAAAETAAGDVGAVTVDDLARDTGYDLTGTVECSSETAMAGTTGQGPGDAAAFPAIAFAREQIGDRYVWGATGPDSWDCSSLVQAAWARAGVQLPRVSRDQFAAVPKVSSKADIQTGDLIFYNFRGKNVSHVAMYTGNGMIIEAAQAGVPVRERPVYWNHLVGIGRPAAL